ncbi:hypothetical protein HAX54_011420, partial [Datura stramonium]|nr:hypothetical protein [Datura stramonium]
SSRTKRPKTPRSHQNQQQNQAQDSAQSLPKPAALMGRKFLHAESRGNRCTIAG